MSDFHEPEGEVAAVASHAGAQTSDAEILTGRPANEQVERAERRCALQEVVGRHVAEVAEIGTPSGHAGCAAFLALRVHPPLELRHAQPRGPDDAKARTTRTAPT